MAVTITTEQVGASTDDCTRFTRGAGDLLNLTSVTVAAGFLNAAGTSIQDSGMRWTTVPVPAGATIDSASLSIYALGGNFPALTKIIGEDADNAATFTDLANYDARSRTTARVDWDIPNIGAWHSTPQFQQSPDIAAIIQEIIDRPGWSNNNAMVLFWDDDGSLASDWVSGRSWDGNSAQAPKLDITYTAAAPVTGGQVIRLQIT